MQNILQQQQQKQQQQQTISSQGPQQNDQQQQQLQQNMTEKSPQLVQKLQNIYKYMSISILVLGIFSWNIISSTQIINSNETSSLRDDNITKQLENIKISFQSSLEQIKLVEDLQKKIVSLQEQLNSSKDELTQFKNDYQTFQNNFPTNVQKYQYNPKTTLKYYQAAQYSFRNCPWNSWCNIQTNESMQVTITRRSIVSLTANGHVYTDISPFFLTFQYKDILAVKRASNEGNELYNAYYSSYQSIWLPANFNQQVEITENGTYTFFLTVFSYFPFNPFRKTNIQVNALGIYIKVQEIE